MKYREEFEAYIFGLCDVAGPILYKVEDGYFNQVIQEQYEIFAAGYEAALKKGRDDGSI